MKPWAFGGHRSAAGDVPLPAPDASDFPLPAPHSARPGLMLLEVLVSMALLLLAMAVVGGQVRSSLSVADTVNINSRAVLLADSKISEVAAGVLHPKLDDETRGNFGIAFPGYTWRMRVEPSEIDDTAFFAVRLEIGFNPRAIPLQTADPAAEIDFEDDGTVIVHTVYRLMPRPADLDLGRDFGLPLDKLQEMAASSPVQDKEDGEGEGGGSGRQQGGIGDPAELIDLIMGFLSAHPEILTDTGSINMDAISELPAEDFRLAMRILQHFVGRGSDVTKLQQQLADSALGDGCPTCPATDRGGGRVATGRGDRGRPGDGRAGDQRGPSGRREGGATGGRAGSSGRGEHGQPSAGRQEGGGRGTGVRETGDTQGGRRESGGRQGGGAEGGRTGNRDRQGRDRDHSAGGRDDSQRPEGSGRGSGGRQGGGGRNSSGGGRNRLEDIDPDTGQTRER